MCLLCTKSSNDRNYLVVNFIGNFHTNIVIFSNCNLVTSYLKSWKRTIASISTSSSQRGISIWASQCSQGGVSWSPSYFRAWVAISWWRIKSRRCVKEIGSIIILVVIVHYVSWSSVHIISYVSLTLRGPRSGWVDSDATHFSRFLSICTRFILKIDNFIQPNSKR